MKRALRRIGKGEDPQVVMEQLSRALMAKLTHGPTHALSHAREDERDQLAELLTRLYQIPRPE